MPKSDENVVRVLRNDGVLDVDELDQFVNRSVVRWDRLDLGEISWARRVVKNSRFGAVLIKQDDGQGNRMHHHPGADEFWCILSGRLLWEMEGNDGSMRQEVVGGGYLVYIPKGRKHRITALCDGAIRLAITAPDVEHVYDD